MHLSQNLGLKRLTALIGRLVLLLYAVLHAVLAFSTIHWHARMCQTRFQVASRQGMLFDTWMGCAFLLVARQEGTDIHSTAPHRHKTHTHKLGQALNKNGRQYTGRNTNIIWTKSHQPLCSRQDATCAFLGCTKMASLKLY